MIEVVKFTEGKLPPYEVVETLERDEPHLVRVWKGQPTNGLSRVAKEQFDHWAASTARALETALCGRSQISNHAAALAVAGHINNGSLGCYGNLEQAISALCMQIDGEDAEEAYLDEVAILAEVKTMITSTDPRYGLESYPVPMYTDSLLGESRY